MLMMFYVGEVEVSIRMLESKLHIMIELGLGQLLVCKEIWNPFESGPSGLIVPADSECFVSSWLLSQAANSVWIN